MPYAVEHSLRSFTGTNRAANTEFTETVPAGLWWLLMSVSVSCAQGATQTPWPSLIVDDGTLILFQAFAGTAAISAATTVQVTWAPGLPAVGAAATTANTGPLPSGLLLGPGYKIRSLTTGIGANTDYAAPQILVTEFNNQPALGGGL